MGHFGPFASRPIGRSRDLLHDRLTHGQFKGLKGSVVGLVVALIVIMTSYQPLAALGSGSPSSVAAVAFSPLGGGWETSSSGKVTPFGNAISYGSLAVQPSMPVVGMTSTADGRGYWLVASDGGIFSFGDAGFYGSTGNIHLNSPIVGMAATPSSQGYWLVASDGGIFSFGDAVFHGGTGGQHLNQPIVGMAATPSGRGYWLVARDGGIFSFGDAVFHGGTGGQHLNQPIVGMAATPSGRGYWLVASDGGIFSFGDARFYGSGPASGIRDPIIGMIASHDGAGYSLIGRDGVIYPFGDASPGNVGAASLGAVGAQATANPSSGYVKKSGTTLTLDGQPYRFTGINIYNAASGGTPTSCGGELYPNVGVPLSEMPDGIVFRFWAFQNFFLSNGSFNWTNLDQVLAIAAAHNDKVIPVLANQHNYCDGPAKDLAWYQGGYRTTVDTGDDCHLPSICS